MVDENRIWGKNYLWTEQDEAEEKRDERDEQGKNLKYPVLHVKGKVFQATTQ